jgi:hypothetical protein
MRRDLTVELTRRREFKAPFAAPGKFTKHAPASRVQRFVGRSEEADGQDTALRRRPHRTRIEQATITIPTLMKPNVTRASFHGWAL